MPSSLRSLWLSVLAVVVVLSAVYVGWLLSRQEVTSPLAATLDTEENSTPPEADTKEHTAENTEVPDSQGVGTTGDGYDDFGSCKADVAAYCAGFNTGDWETFAAANGYTTASWKLGLVDCLGDHRDETSVACDASLDRRQVLNDDVNTLCASDRGTYCRGVKPSPGSEPQVDCLKEHYAQLSAECAAAVDAHEAAKPSAE